MSTKNPHAVVLSGGGANGAFEVGVLEALLTEGGPHTRGRPINPKIYSGTSVGAFNAAYMASEVGGDSPATIGQLKDIWRHEVAETSARSGNGVYRLRGDVLPSFDPRRLAAAPLRPVTHLLEDGATLAGDSYRRLVHLFRHHGPLLERLLEIPDLSTFISTRPLRDLIRRRLDLERLRGSNTTLCIVATDWLRGMPRIFTKDEMTDEDGHQILRASAAIPAVFPPVKIGDDIFVDGGVLMNTPLKPVIAAAPAGTKHLTIHVIYIDPRMQDIPLPDQASTLGTINRLAIMQLGGHHAADLATAAGVNALIAQAEEREALLEAAAKPTARLSAAGRQAAEQVRGHREAVKGKMRVTIYPYRPKTDLGGVMGLLDFHRDRIDDLIEQGYAVARGYEAEREGAVIQD